MQGIKIAFIATGSAAAHSIAGDVNGRCFVWGRNEKGQLGLGDTINRNTPTLLNHSNTKDLKITGAACGRHHSAIITSAGDSYTMGLNTYGQCGIGSVKKSKTVEDMQLAPVKAHVSNALAVACGAEFTMWICHGQLFAAGLGQYGQLGDGDDHQYNASDSSVKMVFDPVATPKAITALADKTVTKVACGHNHTIALCSDGGVWTWGFGGYGRLGHKVQQDESKPRLVETLTGRVTVPADATIAAGGTSSFCTIVGGQLFAWGKLKASGDNTMYPTPFMDLAGWNIRSLSCGATTYGCSARYGNEKSVITWGQSNGYYELGFGESGKKSSANPDKCMALEGVDCYQVAMGVGHSLFLVDADSEVVKKAPVHAAVHDVDESAPSSAPAAGGKRAGGGGGGSKSKKKK